MMEGVARYLTDLCTGLFQANMPGEFEGDGSTPTVIAFIQENLQENLVAVISAMGLSPSLESRADIDQLDLKASLGVSDAAPI